MANVLVNDVAAVRLELHRPRVGPWFAIADLDGVDVPSGAATITIGDGALVLSGTIQPQRSGAFVDRVRVRIVGGAGGLAKTLSPKFYGPGKSGGVAASLPIGELVAAAGEKLSTTADAATLARQLTQWPRLGVAAHQALSTIVDVLGATWRTLDDGSIWIGSDTWPASTIDYALIDECFDDRHVEIATDDPTLRPGVSLDGRNLSYVIYSFEPDRTRVEAWIDLSDGDRFRSGIAGFVRTLVGRQIDPLAKYGATVVAQHDDLTLDLKPDSLKIPGLVGVPIRSTFPGVAAKVAAGSRCDFSFENGDYTRPMVIAFDGGGLKELVITADTVVTVKAPSVRIADGDIPIARAGDLVSMKMPVAFVPGAGAVVYTPAPDPSPAATAYGAILNGSSKGKTA